MSNSLSSTCQTPFAAFTTPILDLKTTSILSTNILNRSTTCSNIRHHSHRQEYNNRRQRIQSSIKPDPGDNNENISIPPPPPPSNVSQSSTPAKPQIRRRAQANKKITSFDATIDNMTMKRMGRGTIYYGEKTEVPSSDLPSTPVKEDDEYEELKMNAILVTGATGKTGQWITLGLLNQDFNVRVMTRSFSKAENIFGPSGSNVDVFEANLTNYEQVKQAVDGSIAIVSSASGIPSWFPASVQNVDVKGIKHLIQAAQECKSVKKFIFISSNNNESVKQSQSEQLIIDSGIPYVIFRINSLSDVEGGLYNIHMDPVVSSSSSSSNRDQKSKISRVDLAQCVCQALVHDRKLNQMAQEDPDAGFHFPNCIISAHNTNVTHVPDKRFWSKAFSTISDAFQTDDDEQEDSSDEGMPSPTINRDDETSA